jgi:peptidoglycan hydrolase-like protein with peptidoglycan-binding domain
LDFGLSKQQGFDVISMDMSVGEAVTRKILPVTSTSNTMVITKGGRSGEAGGKVGNLGLSFNMDLSKSEGVGATTRTLVELGLIEALGKFTQVPYWKCLNADLTNPHLREQALEGFESLKPKDVILFVQRKLGGSMNRYKGPIDGVLSDALTTIVAEYQAQNGLIADGKINFDLYASLLDDTQNELAALPATPPASTYIGHTSLAQASAPRTDVAASASTQFQMRLESNRGANPTYRIGEFLELNLSLNSHGTAYCYYEDASKATFRIFPNQFHADAVLKAGGSTRLTGTGFKIKFDQPGSERVACVGADRELIVPTSVKGAPDLRPLGRSLDDIVSQFKQGNPSAETKLMNISVTR